MVSAVFNDRYKDSLPLGSYVFAIDGKTLASLSPEEVESSLYKRPSDSIILSYRAPADPDSVRMITIPYSVRLKIDSNFQPRQGYFTIFDKKVAYYRINRWYGDNIYNLINHRAEIMTAGTLIIDLRGNGGGYGDDVLATLALFLDKPESIGEIKYPWFEESLVIVPEKKTFRFPQTLRLFILLDQGTACGSEIFILGLKKRANSWSLGDSPTMGAIANPGEYKFPSGVVLRFHTTIGRYHFDSKYYTEGKGLEPDFWIPRTNPRDLYPYQDKLLKEAIRISEAALE
jgi:C-terminal processing protease CtpA/Prc